MVIGGHAVAAHGYGWQTLDVDLLVRDEDRRVWIALLAALGYRVFHPEHLLALAEAFRGSSMTGSCEPSVGDAGAGRSISLVRVLDVSALTRAKLAPVRVELGALVEFCAAKSRERFTL